jgi:hypothetical protein
MDRSHLHDFALRLCEYVRGNIGGHLRLSTRTPVPDHRPKSIPGSRGRKREDPFGSYTSHPAPKGFALWLEHQLTGNLWQYIRFRKPAEHLLTPSDVEDLATMIEEMPGGILPTIDWVPWHPAHTEYIQCLPEIQEYLTAPVAKRFALASAKYIARLEHEHLPLSKGIRIVGEWLVEIRTLLRAMEQWPPRSNRIRQHQHDSDSDLPITDPIMSSEQSSKAESILSGTLAAEFLLDLLKHNAINRDRRRTLAAIVLAVKGRQVDYNNYKSVGKNLKVNGVVDSVRGSKGGYFLTKAGLNAALRLKQLDA